MICQALTFVVLLSIAGSFVNAQQEGDIVFPGPTERPERFPLHTTHRPTNPNTPTSAPVTGVPDVPSSRPTPPVTTQSPVPQSTPSIEIYNRCVSSCLSTSEYNPVCGSDGVVYSNPGRLNCARNCGNPVEIVAYGQCDGDVRG